jgi:hypothetical protein
MPRSRLGDIDERDGQRSAIARARSTGRGVPDRQLITEGFSHGRR